MNTRRFPLTAAAPAWLRAACGLSFLLGLLAHLPVGAGQYANDFNAYFVGQFFAFGDGSTLVSSPPEALAAHVEDPVLKELQLSQWNSTEFRSAFLLPDLDPGNRIYSFSASWVAPVYGDFPDAGEGFSFSFGPVRSLNLVTGPVESGYGAGLCFSVKTGTNEPGFYLLRNGAVIASQTNDPAADWGNFSSTRHSFQVDWDNDTGLTVLRNGSPIFTNVLTDGFVPAAGDGFVWAARGGAASQTYRIDNVSVTTVTQAPPTIRAVSAASGFLSDVVVSADVNTRGLDTTVIFQLGTNTSYGLSATQMLAAATSLNAGLTSPFVLDTDRQIPLHARVTASNALGSVTSGDVLFSSRPFEKQERLAISGGASGCLWADMNDDGLLDLMSHGIEYPNGIARYHINRGATNWLPKGAIRAIDSSASVGDFDNDNRPDVFTLSNQQRLFTTYVIGDIATITYGVASNQINLLGTAHLLAFPFYGYFSLSLVADFDHDGRQDILIPSTLQPDYTGFTNAPDALGGAPRWMRNEFPGARGGLHDSYFHSLPATTRPANQFTFSEYGFISSGDLNGDGFADVYNYGYPDPDAFQSRGWELLLGDGELGLTVAGQGNRGLGSSLYTSSSSVWADFNGDGRDDLVVAEGGSYVLSAPNPPPGRILVLFNDGQGHLTNGPVLMAAGWTDLAAGDLFNHGRNDIIAYTLASDLQSGTILIFRNEGNGVFTTLDYGFAPGCWPSNQGQGMRLADYDRDGRLDFCAVGARFGGGGTDMFGNPPGSEFGSTTFVYRNELDIPSNAPPQAPVNLSTVVGPGTVRFNWGGATDDITPTNLLTYNLRVGTNSLDTSVVSPLANVTNGWRKIAEPGNCRHVFSTPYRFPPGTYYWSVQAVDGGFAGGLWGDEKTFVVPAVPEPQADTVTRAPGRGLKIPVAQLLANDRYAATLPATNIIAVDAVSSGGVPVQRVGDFVLYSPPAGFTGADSFTYIVSDGANQAAATVNVTVGNAPETVTQNITGTLVTGTGALEARAAGIPGRRYQLQHATSLTSPVAWSDLGAAQTASASGQMVFTDPTPTTPGFYRVIGVVTP